MRILKNPKRAVRWYVGLCLFVLTHCFVACSTQHPEVEKAAQTHLEQWKEYYVVALQTGEVHLPLGGKYPHVRQPGPGGLETPMYNVWMVNGGAFGEIIECRGCDSCLTAYQQAGLVVYDVFHRDSTSVRAMVRLTEKGRYWLIENHIPNPHSILKAWRRRERWEMLMVAKEKFEVQMEPKSTEGVYHGKAYRSLVTTPVLDAVGGLLHNDQQLFYQLEVKPDKEDRFTVTHHRIE